ncbi:VanZ family protein [Agrococcus jenensis]|uniref:VanZ like protein n=1 Tax=Agrococcus jenensis TaxID=46353 RepID=A0A3N2AT93_9MICO|nr:VanZ family protein [Agrococcus jenensis]ROR66254.1 VanZ like protein [Agrococcus jenensis]
MSRLWEIHARAVRASLRRVGAVGLAIVAPVALLITLVPTPLQARAKPLVVRGLGWLHDRTLLEWLSWTRLEVLANVAMLVPVALLLTFVLGARRWWLATAICVAASVGVETAQLFMPARVTSLLDVAANGLGALAGAAIAAIAEAIALRARRRSLRR